MNNSTESLNNAIISFAGGPLDKSTESLNNAHHYLPFLTQNDNFTTLFGRRILNFRAEMESMVSWGMMY
jgi:hypothetical protein